ncbi:hypothetical protein GALL_512710 [mine drainage metagenome]|uniref:Uncharacterized protein n=1 Tax=mine drainage metagenome TaxID=410659 RepID=A0A1J5P6F9_9ZZZZ
MSAPVSGLVLERNVRPGDLSAGGATAWYRLAEGGPSGLVGEQVHDPCGQVSRARPRDKRGPVGSHLARPADVCRHHGCAERERLLEPQRLPLPHRCAHHEIGRGEKVGNVVAMP